MDSLVELRGNSPRWVVDVLDALAQARNQSRWEVVSQVLAEYARAREHEAMIICRVTGCNGSSADKNGIRPE